jgi:hypothetical protein
MMIIDSYKFRLSSAILRESTKTKEHKSKTPIQISIALILIFKIL